MRRIGVAACVRPADDPDADGLRIAAFRRRSLQKLGWIDGPQRADRVSLGARAMPTAVAGTRRNWSRLRRTCLLAGAAAAALAAKAGPRPFRSCSRSVADPVGAGFVASLARPGGNITGFTHFEYSIEREMAGAAQGDRAGVTRVAVFDDPAMLRATASAPSIQAAAPLAWRSRSAPIDTRDAAEIERAIAAFAHAAEWRPDRAADAASTQPIAS